MNGVNVMRAWHVDQPDLGHLRFAEDTPVPTPEAGELLLRVLACGVCRTDLHVAEGDLPVHRPGVTPGHEVVGEVVEAAGDFACPCHASAFDPAGKRLSGPSPRDMDALETKIEDGVILVDFKTYRTGTANKVETG